MAKATKKNCRCNCHDEEARLALSMIKHKSCRQCAAALKRERKWLKKREREMMREWVRYLMGLRQRSR